MKKEGMGRVRQLFEQLEAWRHLPAYRLEARADTFFGLYMREVISTLVGQELHRVVVPELPLRLGTLVGESIARPNQSVKVDYALFTDDASQAYFIELKTDQSSRRKKQDEYLNTARVLGMAPILKGILQIVDATNTNYRPKYMHLLARLEKLGFIEVPADTDSLSWLAGGCEVQINPSSENVPIKVLYVQPESDGSDTVIDFKEFGDALPKGDPVAELFREYLIRWRSPAGA